MRRRDLIALLGAAVAWPLAAADYVADYRPQAPLRHGHDAEVEIQDRY